MAGFTLLASQGGPPPVRAAGLFSRPAAVLGLRPHHTPRCLRSLALSLAQESPDSGEDGCVSTGHTHSVGGVGPPVARTGAGADWRGHGLVFRFAVEVNVAVPAPGRRVVPGGLRERTSAPLVRRLLSARRRPLLHRRTVFVGVLGGGRRSRSLVCQGEAWASCPAGDAGDLTGVAPRRARIARGSSRTFRPSRCDAGRGLPPVRTAGLFNGRWEWPLTHRRPRITGFR
jgi:hypothetical protein